MTLQSSGELRRTLGYTVTTRWRQAPRRLTAQLLLPSFAQGMGPQRGQSQNLQEESNGRGVIWCHFGSSGGCYPTCFSVPEFALGMGSLLFSAKPRVVGEMGVSQGKRKATHSSPHSDTCWLCDSGALRLGLAMHGRILSALHLTLSSSLHLLRMERPLLALFYR